MMRPMRSSGGCGKNVMIMIMTMITKWPNRCVELKCAGIVGELR